jgi:hypothetical protein
MQREYASGLALPVAAAELAAPLLGPRLATPFPPPPPDEQPVTRDPASPTATQALRTAEFDVI